MPHRKPVQVTTTTHAFVLAFYAFLTVLGVLHLTNLATHAGMVALYGEVVTTLWALWIVLAGVTALAAAMGSKFLANPTITLLLEAVGVSGLAATSTIYLSSLWDSLGADAVLSTQVPHWAVVIGGVARIVQIGVESRRITRALADPMPASPSPLAEADE